LSQGPCATSAFSGPSTRAWIPKRSAPPATPRPSSRRSLRRPTSRSASTLDSEDIDRMHAYMTKAAKNSRLTAAVIATAVSLGISACQSTDEILAVTDPDIINPDDITSAAGANALRIGALQRLNAATSGGTSNDEGIFMLGGLFADGDKNGDSFIAI